MTTLRYLSTIWIVTILATVLAIGIGVTIGTSLIHSAPSAVTTVTTPPVTNPYLMSCSQLEQTVLLLQYNITSALPNDVFTGESTYLTGLGTLLNYYTQVYNERVSLYYGQIDGLSSNVNLIPAGDGCPYPSE